MTVNYKNLAENLIIVIVSALLGAGIAYYASTRANEETIALLTPTIREAIARETTSIKNEITHDIKVEIDKIKKSDSINIIIDQKPKTTQKPKNKITIKKDSAAPPPEEKKRSWLGRLFKGKKDN